MQREGADPVTGGSGGLADGIVTRVRDLVRQKLGSAARSIGIPTSSVHEMNPIHLPSKISQCLETAFGLRFHMALKGEKKKTSKLEFFLFFTEQSAPERRAESHFLH